MARFVAEERKRSDPEIRAAVAHADIGLKRIDQLKTRAAKAGDPADHAKFLALVEEAVFEQSAIEVPVPLRLVLDDVTAESLEVVLRQQGGRIAIMSDEGGPFELMGGRYSDGIPNIDVYLKGHSGSPIATDRIGREGGSVQNPAITIGLAIQPDVITSLQIPHSRVGSRAADSPPVPVEIRQAYEEAVSALLRLPAQKDDLGEIRSQTLDLSPAAYALLVEFKQAIEPSLGPSGELESIADWGNKLAGTVVRLAGLLHLADHALESGGSAPAAIGESEMRRALRIGDFLCTHARVAFDMMEADHVARLARYILAWIQRTGTVAFTQREAYQPLRARFRAPAEMAPPLELLIEHEVIRRRPDSPRSGPGRPPSPVFEVNPAIHAQNAQNTQNSAFGPPARDSVNSVRGSRLRTTDAPAASPTGEDGVGEDDDDD